MQVSMVVMVNDFSKRQGDIKTKTMLNGDEIELVEND
jgi:hypothetical protein